MVMDITQAIFLIKTNPIGINMDWLIITCVLEDFNLQLGDTCKASS
jgi:hypothetical protein